MKPSLIVADRAAGDTDRAHHGGSRAADGEPAGEGDQTGVGVLDVVKVAPRLYNGFM